MNKKAVVLFSGGLDSTTVLYLVKKQGYQPHALTIDYGQLHVKEMQSARKITRFLKVPHQTIQWTLPWKGSALVDRKIQLPKKRNLKQMSEGIPLTYVPARNTIFLSFALSWAETLRAHSVWIGANAIDYSGYPDCRGNYLKAMEKVFRLGTKAGQEGSPIAIKAPLVKKTKAGIVRLADSLGVPLHWTWSCYEGSRKPCGQCDSCRLRAKGFEEARREDPLVKRGSNANLKRRSNADLLGKKKKFHAWNA
jgi:7-cyano-7-deazaguanine synthase